MDMIMTEVWEGDKRFLGCFVGNGVEVLVLDDDPEDPGYRYAVGVSPEGEAITGMLWHVSNMRHAVQLPTKSNHCSDSS